VYKGHLS